MGCDSSHLSKQIFMHDIRISITDSTFMKKHNEQVRNQMEQCKIQYDFYISLSIFFEEFSKRYYNEVVTNYEDFDQLYEEMRRKNFYPNIYIISDANHNRKFPSNVMVIENYASLIDLLQEKQKRILKRKQSFKSKQNQPTESVAVKILWGPESSISEHQILNSVMKKHQISFQTFENFNQLQQSLQFSYSQFIIVDYVYHQQIIQLVQKTKTKVICYCSFDEEENYAPQLYFVSNSALQIANQVKKQIVQGQKQMIKCTKVYLYTSALSDSEQVKNIIENFDFQVRTFSNPEKVIAQTTYFFCVTVLAAQSHINKLYKYFFECDYGDRVKLVSINKNIQPTTKDFRKVLKELKNGYKIEKKMVKTVDVIDKHYHSTKFQQIIKELQNNEITSFGFQNLTEYIKKKKFISPYIICNFQQRNLMVRYLKQLQIKSKVIIFCNKKKINNDLLNKKCFAFANSHFGKILKFIKKNPVYYPILFNEFEKKLEENLEKIQTKNKRISALNWFGLTGKVTTDQDPENFEFLNIGEKTNNGVIKDIQKTNSLIWKYENNIMSNFHAFKENLVVSLKELKKVFKIQYPSIMFSDLLETLKGMSFHELMFKTKEFFDSNNQFGLCINSSLINLGKMHKKDISYMRQFFILASFNFISFFRMPPLGKRKLKHWVSHNLIEKCQVGSYLFSKQFSVMYEDLQKESSQKLSDYKIELEIDYDTLTQENLYIKPFFVYKDKYIFCPYTEFQLEKIEAGHNHKIITLKYMGNTEFLINLYQDNFLGNNKNLMELFEKVIEKEKPYSHLINKDNQTQLKTNFQRIKSIKLFREDNAEEAIAMHEKLIQSMENEENYDYTVLNQLKYELVYFLNGKKNPQFLNRVVDLVESHPGAFIKQACQTMIKKFKINKEDNENNEEEFHEVRLKKKQSTVSQDVYETFLWLQNNEDDESCLEEKKSDSKSMENHYQKYEDEINCLQVDDLGYDEDFEDSK